MPAKMRRMARTRQEQVNQEYQQATRVVGDFSELTEDEQRKDIRRPGAAVRMSRSTGMSSTLSICPRREWCMRTPFPWIGGPP
jgi:hypothetical protein